MFVEFLLEKNSLYALVAGFTTLILIQFVLYFINLKKIHSTLKQYSIPGPEPSVFGGNYFELISEGDRYDIHCQWSEKYGKVFGYYAGYLVMIVVSDLDILKELFFNHNDVMTERSELIMDVQPLKQSIFFASHQRWKIMRKLLTPAFNFYGSKAADSTKFIEQSVTEFMECLDKMRLESDDKKAITNVDIQDLLKAMALNLISSLAIKLKKVEVKRNNPLVSELDSYLKISDSGLITLASAFPGFSRPISFLSNNLEYNSVLAKIHKEAGREIDTGLKYLNGDKSVENNEELKAIYDKEEPNSVIHRMIKMLHDGQLTRDEVMGNVEAILIAGFDTTSTTLAYIFWCLAKHSEVQEKLRLDIIRFGPESQYLTQVINEVMRLYVTVNIFTKRKLNRDLKIGKWTFPKKSIVNFNSEIVHHDPDYWPDPYKFDPDRFAPSANIHPCAFAPFGLGERRCSGYKLAMLEMKFTVCNMLAKYKLKLVSPIELKLVRYGSVLTKPRDKIVLNLEYI